jgi:hypothetical protein
MKAFSDMQQEARHSCANQHITILSEDESSVPHPFYVASTVLLSIVKVGLMHLLNQLLHQQVRLWDWMREQASIEPEINICLNLATTMMLWS